MARTFKLVSGTDEVDLIESAASGIIASRGGFGNNETLFNNTYSSSPLTDGSRLRLKKTLPVVARYELNLKGSSHDNVASQLQALERILRKGDNNQLTQWQQDPLYIQQQTTNETGARYSKVISWNSETIADFFDQPYESSNELENFEIVIVREPYWRNHPPGYVPPKHGLSGGYKTVFNPEDGLEFDTLSPAWDKAAQFTGSTTVADYFDAVSDAGAKLSITEGAQHDGKHGLEIDNANTTSARGQLNIAGSPTTNFACFWFHPNSIELGTGALRIFQLMGVGGALTDVLYIEIVDSTKPYQVEVKYSDDSSGDISLDTLGIPDDWTFITAYWESASAPAADDGIIRVSFYKDDGTLLGTLEKTDIDSDGITLDNSRFGCVESAASAPSGTFYIDSVLQDVDGSLFPLSFAGVESNYGVAIPINNYTSRIGTISSPSNETEMTFEFFLDVNSISMPAGIFDEQFVVVSASGSGSAAEAWRLTIAYDTDNNRYELILGYGHDAGGGSVAALDHVALTDECTRIVIQWKASTGLDDGKILMTAGAEQVGLTGIDNDIFDIDTIEVGADDYVVNTATGMFFIDKVLWSDQYTTTKYKQQLDFELTTAMVANFRQENGVISHIYMEDNNLAAFSANLVHETSFPYFEVSGSTPAVSDAVYFGSDEPFYQVAIYLGVAGDNDGVTYEAEFWNGGAWADFPGFDGSTFVGERGPTMLSWEGISAWATTAVNGVTKYWVRIKITAITTWTTSPEQGHVPVFAVADPYFELNSSQIGGDVPALAITRLFRYASPINIVWGMMGIKSRGLTNFVSRLNPGGSNPTGWSETYGTDTSQIGVEDAPGGNIARCTFGGDQTLIQRVTMQATDADIESDFEGTYRIYLRARQEGGSAGEVSVQLKVSLNTLVVGDTINMLQVSSDDTELIDMGVFSIKQFGTLGDEVVGAATLQFQIFASSSGGSTPNLDIYDLVLMPIDELAMSVEWYAQANQALTSAKALQIDGGILREAVHEQTILDKTFGLPTVQYPLSAWQAQGVFPSYEPRKNMRVYFLFADTDGIIKESGMGQSVGVEVHTHNRWYQLRGVDK